ncbi:uncharacterized protein ACWYII_010792 isoform 2-T2 [Salvelinus alpinus]
MPRRRKSDCTYWKVHLSENKMASHVTLRSQIPGTGRRRAQVKPTRINHQFTDELVSVKEGRRWIGPTGSQDLVELSHWFT